MSDRVVQLLFWLRRRSFFRVVQRTFMMLMPVAVIGSYFQLLRDCIFSPDSLIYNIFNFDYIMSDRLWDVGNLVSAGMVQVTFGIFGIFAAYFSALYTARIYHKDATMAGITSVIVITFTAFLSGVGRVSGTRITFYSRILNINGILFALLCGYLVGQVFHWLGQDYHHIRHEHAAHIQARAWSALIPTAVSLLVGIVFGIIIYLFKVKLLDDVYFRSLISGMKASNNLALIIPLTMLATFLWWCGIGYPLASMVSASNSGAAIANLNYALRHGGANVPYKYLGSSLIQGYGLMGDACVALSLTVVILLYTHNKQLESIAKINLLPVAFGASNGLAIGLPMILNPLYLLPIIVIPAINELIAAGAITLNLIWPSVYPVLGGTPGILISFFGSNGNWPTFIFTVLLFILDILILIPVVLIGQRISERLAQYEQEMEN
ncbi:MULTISPECIES: PTS transporter subunit EIIC [Lactobacillus]|uniref:PTS sugar transporter subunit IIC n=1 Tax=Lactobacillus xujianguonis TaxID=2495899 RepID=A0A437SWX0_9LACO|nr:MULTISPECIES: PTS transporter subunit EIIC [Lactobacillus]RVU71426.1 PTS sugar transporter subunit IIC [Lactobacillus xujianguonis]RVU72389.1 PTS sugar transporter subunit IIC [Lactobacillus xujianguonis]